MGIWRKDGHRWALAVLLGCVALLTCTPVAAAAGAGSISGKVTAASGHAPIASVDVEVITASHEFVGFALTEASGDYKVKGLAQGSYKVEFYPPAKSEYAAQYYKNKYTFTAAEVVPVTEAAETANINAELGEGGKIAGTKAAKSRVR
jgi:hypothetical protein